VFTSDRQLVPVYFTIAVVIVTSFSSFVAAPVIVSVGRYIGGFFVFIAALLGVLVRRTMLV
jgi:hypothetical protein